ncbi:MAG: antibiotic biosynthesis monooxygenase [Mucilaginibacter sp.]|nr:antibiotic biosynthesis monooxygenase [Mucilaginibacter sp.]
MKQIFIDKFIVPANAGTEFTDRMNYNRNFIKNLEGFIDDTVYKRTDEAGNQVILTIAVWQNADALNNARLAVQAEYQRISFNPAVLLAKWDIKMERDIYEESVD